MSKRAIFILAEDTTKQGIGSDFLNRSRGIGNVEAPVRKLHSEEKKNVKWAKYNWAKKRRFTYWRD